MSVTTQVQTTPNVEFDWEAYENEDYKRKLKGRHPVSTSKDPESQKLYEMLLASVDRIVEPRKNGIVEARILSVGERYAYADIGWTEDAIIDLTREDSQYRELFSPGNVLEVIVKKADLADSRSDIEVSYTEVVTHLKYREIFNSIGEKVAYLARVKELIHGGYFLDIEGVEVFMPGSLGGVNKLVNFDELLGKDIYVVPINYSKEKEYIVVSHREYLQSLIPQAMDNIDVGDECNGFVTGTTKFGVFVEFNDCLTGLIHKTDLDDETLNDFHNRDLKPGSEITFRIKEVTNKNRIILTQKELVIAYDPWSDIDTKYRIPSEVTGKVRKKTKYGLFVELEPKVVGLLHVSDIPDFIDIDNIDEGNDITLNLIKIDKESKKVFFKI
jgi:small subunit ribosomal protein S1